MRVLIIHKLLEPYRLDLFSALGEIPEFELSVIHSGVARKRAGDSFREEIVHRKESGSFYKQEIKAEKYENSDLVIFPFDLHSCDSLSAPYRSKLEGKIIYFGQGKGHHPLANYLRYWQARKARGLLLYEDPAARWFLSKNIPSSRIQVFHNSILVPNAGYNPNPSRGNFLYVGRIQPRKDVEEMLQAFSLALPSLSEGTGLEIVGAGPHLEKLKKLARNLKIERQVLFHGEIRDPAKLRPIFWRALAYISPGHVGLGVLHSFAYGVPVITRRGEKHAPEYVNLKDSQNGIKYQGGSRCLADIMIRLSKNPELSREMGREGYRYYISERPLSRSVGLIAGALKTWVSPRSKY